MKKIVSALLFAVMLFTSLFNNTVVALAVQNEDVAKTQIGTSNVYYEYNAQSKTLTVSGNGDTPNFENDSVSQPWYAYRSDGSIDNIVICEGITSIGNYFFYKVNAENIALPDSLEKIGGYAFCGNKNVKSVTFGKGLKTISNNAFYQCSVLESVYVPKSVSSIGTSAFESCKALKNVSFERMNMTVTISRRAFLDCPSLVSIDIPIGATLSSQSVGFKTSSGEIESNMVMGIYRDSPAYRYAERNFVNYRLIDSIEIFDGDVINRTYYADSVGDDMKFYFTPEFSCQYDFTSSGDVDVDCALTYSNGNKVADCNESNDISENDLNFLVSCKLSAGEVYCYTVNSVNSEGSFSVSISPQHSYVREIVAPEPYEDGYTLNTCIYCGDCYKSDFTDKLAHECSGCVYQMKSADGSVFEDKPLGMTVIYDFDGRVLGTTDENGSFNVAAYKGIVISAPYGVDRRIEITEPGCNLGSIAIVNCDFCPDGYINAKDFAVFKSFYGKCDSENYMSVMLDTDNDGEIGFDDWSYASEFTAYGKIDETVYANSQ